jgi:hypothetical protein
MKNYIVLVFFVFEKRIKQNCAKPLKYVSQTQYDLI